MGTPFAHQVAGHPSTIQASPTGAATVIKPALPVERAFYTQLGPSLAPDFIGKYTPAFFGTLRLEGRATEDGGVTKDGLEDEVGQETVVLENLTFRFVKPNVFDIKLGTQLYDDAASEDKKLRMAEAAKNTTSGTKGVRLTGFQYWEDSKQAYTVVPKQVGKALKPEELPAGFARFFTPLIEAKSPLLKPILEALLGRVKEIIAIWKTFEVRMRGGSILFVIEGQHDKLEEALKRDATRPSQNQENEDDDSDAESTDSQGGPLPETLRAWEMRLIDFAHCQAVPGQGPDEGVLLGLNTVKELFEGLLEQA